MKIRHAAFLLAALAIVTPAQAQVLRAHKGNSGIASDGAGIFFNLSAIGGRDLSITGFDFHTWLRGANVDVTLYTRRGSYAGFTTDPASWTNQGTTTVASTAGLAAPNFVDTPDFTVSVGKETGVYFFIETNGIGYATSAQGVFRGQFIDDGNLRLEAGVSRNALFGGMQFGLPSGGSYRGFAGNIHYGAIPAPAGVVVLGFASLVLTQRRQRGQPQAL